MRHKMNTASRLLLAAAVALGGCEAMPIGSFEQPQLTADSAQAQHDLYFTPGAPSLAPGEQQRLNAFLAALALGPTQDVVLNVGRSGSPVLDAQRAQTLQRAFAGTRARVRPVYQPGFVNSDTLPDTVLVQVIRYDRIRIACPGMALPGELTTPLPPAGCANGINMAEMAYEKRDLIAPRELHGSEAGIAAAAEQRHRAGKVITLPIDVNGG
jgi:type IV pilus biogenesis protein CpaD/CtpE